MTILSSELKWFLLENVSIYHLFSLFLLLFIGPIALFSIINESYCTISINFYSFIFFTVLSTIIFQFQQNKRYLNTHLIFEKK